MTPHRSGINAWYAHLSFANQILVALAIPLAYHGLRTAFRVAYAAWFANPLRPMRACGP